MKKPEFDAKTIAIQAAVFVVCLLMLEGVGQIYERWLKPPKDSLGLNPAPYIMFHANAGPGKEWYSQITKQKLQTSIVYNNYGYPETYDYQMIPDAEYLKKHAKKQGETLVFMAGGSTVHGVGASSNDHTISAQMQRHLNEHGGGKKYRVMNMGMGSWIAYQEFVGLSMFGAPLNPDWVVVMDGVNDGATPCAQGSGAGNPLSWSKMLFMLQGGKNPEGVNPAISALSRHSALIRSIFGIDSTRRAIPSDLVYDNDTPDKRFAYRMANLKFNVQDEQVRFYLQAQRNMLALFSRANMILSTAPTMYDNGLGTAYRAAFRPGAGAGERQKLEADLDSFMRQSGDDECSIERAPQLDGYFISRAALALKDLVAEENRQGGNRKLMYVNTDQSMPFEVEKRGRFFLDNGHMVDDGQERIGVLYAEMILAAEQGKPFNYAAFIAKYNGK